MPGLVLNGIANMGATSVPTPPPYVPTYDSIYVSSFNLYQVSGSTTGGTQGGIVKMDFSGSIDSTWMSAANTGGTVGYTFKNVRFSQGARDHILIDTRLTSASVDYRQTRLIKKSDGTIAASGSILPDSGGDIFSMDTDSEERHVYVMGSSNIPISAGVDLPAAFGRFHANTLNLDATFSSSIGDGPTNRRGGSGPIVRAVHVNPSGKIGVAHNGSDWDNNANKYDNFVVLNFNGTVDTSFDFGNSEFTKNGTPIPGGAIDSVLWLPSGSDEGIWIVAGDFDAFGTGADSGSYKHIMAFNQNGSVNTGFTDTLEGEGLLNSRVRDIAKVSDTYFINLGDFTQFGSTTSNKLFAMGNDGSPQLAMGGSNSNAYEGVYYNNNLYWVYNGTSTTDNSANTENVDGMYSVNVFSFNHNPNFDIGVGLEQSGGSNAEPGSIFLG
jgi:hypothetical protein